MAALAWWRRGVAPAEGIPRGVPLRPNGQRYPRDIESKVMKAGWEGPYYFRSSRWHEDLLLVLEQVRLSVKANMPPSPAFAAAAEDYLHRDTTWSPQRVARLSKIIGLSVLLALSLLAALGALATEGPEALHGLFRPVAVAIWLFFVALKRHHKPVSVLASLQASIEAGNSLSESMGRLPRFFPMELTSLVAMAEKTGNLADILENFSGQTVKNWTAQRDLGRVLRYIGFSLILQAGIITFLAVKVLSVFEEIFLELSIPLGSEHHIPGLPLYLPLPSIEDIFYMANFVSVHRYHVVMICWLVGLWIVLRPWRKRRVWSSRIESTLLLSIPGLRGLVARQNLATVAFLLSQFLRAGVPLEQALAAVGQGGVHPLYRRWVMQVRKRIMNGSTLHDACRAGQPVIPVPGSFVSLLSMGETHGRLESSLSYIAEQYQAAVDRRKQLLRSCVLPLGVFFLGYIVLSIEASMFQALVDLADSILQ